MTIGIDLSMTSTGVVVLTNDKELLWFKTIKTSPKDNIYKRVMYVLKQLDIIINYFNTASIVIEAPAFAAKGSRVYQMFGFHFVTTMLIFRYKNNVNQVVPSKLKKTVTGKGNANKDAMLQSLIDLDNGVIDKFRENGFKKSTGLYDLVDAYFLAYYYGENNG